MSSFEDTGKWETYVCEYDWEGGVMQACLFLPLITKTESNII